MKTVPLRRFVRRVLLLRLAAATAVIAVVVAGMTYAVQQRQLGRAAVDLGRRGVASLTERVRMTMEQRRTDALTALRVILAQDGAPVRYRAGRFVSLQVYEREGVVLAERVASDQQAPEQVKAFLAGRPLSFPATGQDEAEPVRIGEDAFILVTSMLGGRSDRPAVFVRGLFAVSEEELALMRRTMLRNTLVAALIVVAVSGLLYPVILRLTGMLADYSARLLDANLETLLVLGSAIAKRDSDTDAHNFRVTLYSIRIGEALGCPAEQLRTLIKGAFLHDVGKLGIPDNILLKPGRLDTQEFSVMKTHVDKGEDIVQRSSWLRDGQVVVGCHHEKFGGGGYPRGLAGESIPITARIFSVSDVFDALTSHRPYKQPLTFEETMALLEQDRGTHFDPVVLDAFGRIARDLYDRYHGRAGADLNDELAAVVTHYFSAGMETLLYGKASR